MTINTVRPDTDYRNNGLIGVGGAVTVAGGTGDVSDTTGVTANNDNDYGIVNLANPPALASNERVKAWRIRVRVARTALDQHNQRVEVKLRNSANQLSAADTIQYGSTTVAEFIGPWRASGPGNLPFTTTNLNAMRADIVYRPRVGGANEWLETRGLFVDFDYNTRPTVSGVDILNPTTTNFPDITWVYADTEGDPQVAFRVKVFPQSVASGGGFDPETNGLATWDSGDQSGNQDTITVGKSLSSGVSYVPYVKVGQRWDGPEGPIWWSSWVAGTAETISPSAPAAVAVPVITLLNSLPDYRALHTVTAGSAGGGTTTDIQLQRLEKVARLRGDFYNWVHPQIASCGGLTIGYDGFYPRNGSIASLPLDTVAPSTGVVNARVISWTSSDGSGLDIGLNNVATTDESPPYAWPSVPGLLMRASMWLRVRTGTLTAFLHHLSVNAGNSLVTSGDQLSSSLSLTTSWQRVEFSFTPPANSVYGRLFLDPNGTIGKEVLIYGVQVGPDPGAGAVLQDGLGQYLAPPPDTSWEDVRTREARTGLASGAKAYIVDHELIPGRPLVYRVRAVTTITGNAVAGPWTYYTMYCPKIATTLLRDPYQPENLITAKRDGRSQSKLSEDSSTFHANGRNEDPIVQSDWRSGQDGSMTIYWANHQEKKKVQEIVGSNRSVLVQWFDGGASFVRFLGDRNFDIQDSDYGIFTGEYLAQARP